MISSACRKRYGQRSGVRIVIICPEVAIVKFRVGHIYICGFPPSPPKLALHALPVSLTVVPTAPRSPPVGPVRRRPTASSGDPLPADEIRPSPVSSPPTLSPPRRAARCPTRNPRNRSPLLLPCGPCANAQVFLEPLVVAGVAPGEWRRPALARAVAAGISPAARLGEVRMWLNSLVWLRRSFCSFFLSFCLVSA